MLDMCDAAAGGHVSVSLIHNLTKRPQLLTETGEAGVKGKSVTIL